MQSNCGGVFVKMLGIERETRRQREREREGVSEKKKTERGRKRTESGTDWTSSTNNH